MKTESNGHFRKVLEFERFRFYPSDRQLELGGKPVRLTSRLMDLLILLIDHHGEVVTKETILQSLWPNSFVEENNINQAVSSLRKELGNGSVGGEFIETIPKAGFRFIAPVTESNEEVRPRDRDRVQTWRLNSVRAWIAASLIVSVMAVIGYWYLGTGKRSVSKDGLINLTNNLAEDSYPVCSPDGKKIAFTSNRDGNSNIYSMNIDGSDVRRLTNVRADEQGPTWSPDGKKIVFESNRDGNFELYMMNASGSEQTRLTFNPTTDGGPARFSPDGKKVAFARSGAIAGLGYYNFDIYSMNLDGSDLRQLTTDQEYDASPIWSPDGSKIAFVSGRNKGFDVFVMNADGSDQTDLTNSPENDGPLDWTPDGQKIIFTGENNARNIISQIWIMNADGTGRRQITSFGDNSYRVYSASPVRGRFVVTSRTEGNSEIYFLDVDLPAN